MLDSGEESLSGGDYQIMHFFYEFIDGNICEEDIPENDTKEEWAKIFSSDNPEYEGMPFDTWEEFEELMNDRFDLSDEDYDEQYHVEEIDEWPTPFDYFWDVVTKTANP